MKKINRRNFLYRSFVATTASILPLKALNESGKEHRKKSMQGSSPAIIDTNVNINGWPFRRLKYGETGALVEKLRLHRIDQAWAGSFEALFHRNLEGVNSRLAEECRQYGDGMLVPFGTVNPEWPDWEEDLRRCHEDHKMPGIRIYPGYQGFDQDHTDFESLVYQTAERGMILQIACDMEDSRLHHPIVHVRNLNVEALIPVLKQLPEAKIQLLYWNHQVGRNLLDRLVSETNVALDISRLEGCGGVHRLIEGIQEPWSYYGSIPVPAERVFFGSHAPFFPLEANIMKLFESPLTKEQMTAIMNGNARRFLG